MALFKHSRHNDKSAYRAGSHRKTFRRGFDLSLPLWNPYALSSSFLSSVEKFSYFIIVPIKFASHNVKMLLRNLFNKNDCLVLDACDVVNGNFLCDSHGNTHHLDTIIKVCTFLSTKGFFSKLMITEALSLQINFNRNIRLYFIYKAR